MKRFTLATSFLLFAVFQTLFATEPVISPRQTVKFATKDSRELFFDLYRAADGSETQYKGKDKPTIMFIFGGGFKVGNRDGKLYLPWFKDLVEQGYNVVSIDYRLGLKDAKNVSVAKSANLVDKAIHMAVEDAFDATRYILDHACELGLDARNIVICGSSAGAITSLQAEYELCNRTEYSKVLPPDFHYAGVISYAGAIISRDGALKFKESPCPIMLLHGTKDAIVEYRQIRFFKDGLFGSHAIATRMAKFGFVYDILRYRNHEHEIAGVMQHVQSFADEFIKTNVIEKSNVVVDMMIDDPAIPFPKTHKTAKDLYK